MRFDTFCIMDPLYEINDLNFADDVISFRGTFLLSFGATWCPPCLRLVPVLRDLAGSTDGTIRVGKLDIDEAPLTTTRFSVRGAPTLIVFRNGEEIERTLGAPTRSKLERMVR